MTSGTFYRDFEADFRGSRDEISERLRVYVPFLRPFVANSPGRPELADLGCGRGEWLELAEQNGMRAVGVDLDEGMLQACFSRGLSARKMDGLEFLRSLPDNSQAVVSAIHVVEHLPFQMLQSLVAEAHRVLQPGGLLICETPNPENLNVGTVTFHLDPTHYKPLPPSLLSYVPRYFGFIRCNVLRLQEQQSLSVASTVRLIDVFRGVSPDYAVVAQKAGEPAILAQFDSLFAADYGLTLDTLAQRFEAGLSMRFDTVENRMRSVEDQLRQFLDYQQRLEAIYESTSWRITRPLRTTGRFLVSVRASAKRRSRACWNSFIGRARRLTMIAASRPMFRAMGKKLLGRYPRVANRIRSFLFSSYRSQQPSPFMHSLQTSQLSPKARLLHQKILSALGKNGKYSN